MYMDEHMTLSLDPRLGVFTLESPSGSLDSHVQLVDLRPEKFSGIKTTFSLLSIKLVSIKLY